MRGLLADDTPGFLLGNTMTRITEISDRLYEIADRTSPERFDLVIENLALLLDRLDRDPLPFLQSLRKALQWLELTEPTCRHTR